jgi:hypothetical protein
MGCANAVAGATRGPGAGATLRSHDRGGTVGFTPANHPPRSSRWRMAPPPVTGRLDLRRWRSRPDHQRRPECSLLGEADGRPGVRYRPSHVVTRRSLWRRCFPSSPPSSPSSPSIVAMLQFVPGANRMTAPGRMRTGRAGPRRQWGTGSLRGDLPPAPHRAAIPGTVPFSNRGARVGPVALHRRVASTDADPFPQRKDGVARPRPSSRAIKG